MYSTTCPMSHVGSPDDSCRRCVPTASTAAHALTAAPDAPLSEAAAFVFATCSQRCSLCPWTALAWHSPLPRRRSAHVGRAPWAARVRAAVDAVCAYARDGAHVCVRARCALWRIGRGARG